MRTVLPSIGDTRTRSFFALLPVTIGTERRWLETVCVKEQFRNYGAWPSTNGWVMVGFADTACGKSNVETSE